MGRAQRNIIEAEVCDICGRPTYDGSTCRHCRKREEWYRRTLRLVKERKRERGMAYGRV